MASFHFYAGSSKDPVLLGRCQSNCAYLLCATLGKFLELNPKEEGAIPTAHEAPNNKFRGGSCHSNGAHLLRATRGPLKFRGGRRHSNAATCLCAFLSPHSYFSLFCSLPVSLSRSLPPAGFAALSPDLSAAPDACKSLPEKRQKTHRKNALHLIQTQSSS